MTRFFSQHGEDARLFDHFSGKKGGFFVEVGALDGVTLSNTWFFERELDWTGILVEANPSQAEKCARARPRSAVVSAAVVEPKNARQVVTFHVVDGEEALSSLNVQPRYWALMARISADREVPLRVSTAQVPTTTLDEVLTEHAAPHAIDFMSIDIEGHELAALRGLSLGRPWRPKVLLIESTTTWPEIRILALLFRGGYAYQRTIVINDWYEPRSLAVRLMGIARIYLSRIPRALRKMMIQALGRLGLLEAARGWRSRLFGQRHL